MKAQFEQGSTVKITDQYATALSKRKGKPLCWLSRKGVVVHCGPNAVSVMWDGRKSLDYVPLKGVELASL